MGPTDIRSLTKADYLNIFSKFIQKYFFQVYWSKSLGFHTLALKKRIYNSRIWRFSITYCLWGVIDESFVFPTKQPVCKAYNPCSLYYFPFLRNNLTKNYMEMHFFFLLCNMSVKWPWITFIAAWNRKSSQLSQLKEWLDIQWKNPNFRTKEFVPFKKKTLHGDFRKRGEWGRKCQGAGNMEQKRLGAHRKRNPASPIWGMTCVLPSRK